MIFRAILLTLIVGLCAACLESLRAAEDAAEGVIRFHRIMAPESRISEWPVDGGRYLPLDAAEFDRLVEQSRARLPEEQSVPPIAFSSLRYEARLTGETLIGQATADIVLASQKPAALVWQPCSMALGRVVWESDANDSTPHVDRLPLGFSANGQTFAVIERSGRLRFDWSLVGKRDSTGILEFMFETPLAPENELLLELPAGLTPMFNRGVLAGSTPLDAQTRRWTIEFGGCTQVRLRLLPEGVPNQRPPLALLRESRTYDLSPRGAELTAIWRLQAHHQPLRQIVLLLDPGLQLVSVKHEDQSLQWSVTPSDSSQLMRVVLTLPDPIRQSEQVLRLRALARPVIGPPWRLPRIRAEDLVWQEGNITILTSEPLLVDNILPIGCHQTGTGLLSAPRTGETAQFQAFEPDATVELLLSRRVDVLHGLSGTMIELGAEQATARCAADFQIIDGARFLLDAEIAPHWIIDSVDSAPTGAVADWNVDPGPDDSQLLSLRLAVGLSASQPLRLIVTGRRPLASTDDQLAAAELPPLRFRGLSTEKNIVAVRPADGYVLKLSDADRRAALRPSDLTPVERDLFTELSGATLLPSERHAGQLQIALEPQRPKYTGSIRIHAEVYDDKLVETCRIRCTPELGRLDRVVVQFYPQRAVPPLWTIDGDQSRFIARRLPAESIAGDNSPPSAPTAGNETVETWELWPTNPLHAPVEIVAVREDNLTLEKRQANMPFTTLTLASLPEAAVQEGQLVVTSTGSQPFAVDGRRLRPVAVELPQGEHPQTIYAAFSYDPAWDLADNAAAARLVSEPVLTTSGCWAWNCQLDSWHDVNGKILNRAAFDVQYIAPGRFHLRLPSGVAREDLRGVWINNKQAQWRLTVEEPAPLLTFELPSKGGGRAVVTVEYTGLGPPLTVAGAVSIQPPVADFPVLSTYWSAWLPPGYEFLGRDAGIPLPAEIENTQLTPGDKATVSDTPGWTKRQIVLTADKPLKLYFVQTATLRMLSLICFLAVAAAGCWTLTGRPAIGVGLFGCGAVAVVAGPSQFMQFGWALMAGVLVCQVWIWLRSNYDPATTAHSGKQDASVKDKLTAGSTVSMAGKVGFLLAAIIPALTSYGMAQVQEASVAGGARVAQPPYRVIVPIDENRNPVGNKLFVPEALYRKLHRTAVEPGEKPHDYLIIGAFYRGLLAAESGTVGLTVDRIVAEYDIRVFNRGTRVRIPIGAEGAAILPKGVLLDGRLLEPQWQPVATETSTMKENSDEAFWENHLAPFLPEPLEPGDYRLEIAIRPTIHTDAGQTSFDMSIPPVPSARLEIALPTDPPTIEVPSACGLVHIERSPSRLMAELGPADRLTVRWRQGTTAQAGPAVDVQEYLWVKFRPGSVVVDAKFELHAVEGSIEQLQLSVDPRLRVLPPVGEKPPSVHVGPTTGRSRIIAFHWPEPVEDRTTLTVTFLLSEATGVGNFRLPHIELLDARPIKRWLAVSVDPALDSKQKAQQLEAVSVADFEKAWTSDVVGDNVKPLSAYRLPAGEIDWSISTRPRQPSTTAVGTLNLTFDMNGAAVLFEAELQTVSGYLFQYRIIAPPELKVESVSLLEGEVERAGRWARQADGSLNVFLNGATAGQQRLVLRGRLPTPMKREWLLPSIRVDGCRLGATTTRLFTRPSILAKIRADGPLEPAAPPTGQTNELGQFLAAYVWHDMQSPPVGVTLTPSAAAEETTAAAAAIKAPTKSSPRELPKQLPAVVQGAVNTVYWSAEGGSYGTAAFDVQPGGAGEAILRLPDGCQLISLSVAGWPTAPEPVGSQLWRFPLAAQPSGQQVKAVYSGNVVASDNAGRWIVHAPILDNLKVRRTVWRIVGPGDWTLIEPDESRTADTLASEPDGEKLKAARFEFDEPVDSLVLRFTPVSSSDGRLFANRWTAALLAVMTVLAVAWLAARKRPPLANGR